VSFPAALPNSTATRNCRRNVTLESSQREGEMAAKKNTAGKKTPRRAAAKRELIAPRGSKRYVRRDAKGRIKESDDVGRSLAADRRRQARTVAKPGQGDRGDRR
jgi:hypothetical protein